MKKHHRKGRKSGRVVVSESEEEDQQNVHTVNILSGEMPEGAVVSDGEDEKYSPDDPHRALDINLEEPLRDEERLPVHHHRNPELNTNNGSDLLVKKNKREKSSRSKKTKKSKESSKRRSRSKTSLIEESQQNGDADIVEPKMTELKNGLNEEKKREPKLDDIEFWLTNDTLPTTKEEEPAATQEQTLVQEDESLVPPSSLPLSSAQSPNNTPETSRTKSEKVKKKKKKEKSKKGERRSKRERNDSLLLEDQPKDKNEYEEAPGITTPSKEPGNSVAQTPMTPSMPPASNYQLLAEDNNIKLTYETRTMPNQPHELVVSVVFSNRSPFAIREMELNVLDTLNTKLVRGGSSARHQDAVKVPFALPPANSNEGQFIFSTESIVMSQRLRGTLTYMLETPNGLTHEKLDLKVHLPVSSYMIGTMNKRDTFTELLSTGELSAKSNFAVNSVDLEFSHILAKICFHCHFSVVEQMGMSASMYSRSIQDDHVCLLVKLSDSTRLSVDGKSTNGQLLPSLLDEIKALFTPISSPQ